MKLRTRVLAVASTLAVAGGLVAAFGGTASATIPPVDVGNSTVTCNTLTGKITFVPPLAGTAQATDNNLITKIDGCSTPTAGINLEAGAIAGKGTLHSANGSCATLLGTNTVTTTVPIVLKWKVPAGTAKPNPLTSTVGITQIVGGLFAPGGTWGSASYGDFQVTAGHSTVSGAFTGGDAGASSSLEATTGQDIAALGFQCGGVGIKYVTLGIGHINLG